jgi:adenylate kinase family enzyme
MNKTLFRRINVVGTSGSGKSTFSRQLADVLKYPYIEMDALFWKPDWEQSTDKEFFAKLEKYLQQTTWILDGNYSRTTNIKWKEVDTVIWLNYSWQRTVYQSITRAIKRSLFKQTLWAGNKESFKKSFFSRDSIILWMLQNYHRQQQQYLMNMNDPQWRHIQFIRISNSKHAKQFLQQLQNLSND